MEKLFIRGTLIGSIILIVYIYVTQFQNASEDDLVRTSYLWLPLLIFGLTGNYALNRIAAGKKIDRPLAATFYGLIRALIVLVLLYLFYEVIWPSL